MYIVTIIGETGYLVSNTDDFAEFSNKVRYLLDTSPGTRLEMGAKARRWAERFGWEAATSKLRNM